MQNATPLVSRRNLLTGIVAAPALAAAGATLAHAEDIDAAAARAKAALKSAKGTKLVLLGTGSGPIPGLARRMASNLMVHNEAAYVLDCGLGVTDQYARTGIPFSALRSIFITHHHPDHNIEYGPLLIIGWTSGIRQAVRAYGPPPLMQMTADYFRSAKPTIDFWAEDFRIPPLQMIEVQEIRFPRPVDCVFWRYGRGGGCRADGKRRRRSGPRSDGLSCHRGIRAPTDCRRRSGIGGSRYGSHACGSHVCR